MNVEARLRRWLDQVPGKETERPAGLIADALQELEAGSENNARLAKAYRAAREEVAALEATDESRPLG